MTIRRRKFLATAGLTAAATILRPSLSWAREPDATYFKWTSLTEDAWVGTGEGGNTLVLMGKSAAALIDCKHAPFGKALRREAEALGAPIKLVINTHHHADHTGGNHAFSGDLPILAHEKAKPRIAGNMNRYISAAKEAVTSLTASTSPAAPKVREEAKAYHDRMNDLKAEEFEPKTLVKDSRDLEIGGHQLTIHHFGPGHTDNDLVVFIPRQNIVHTGDLLFHKRHPFLDAGGGGSVQGWIDALQEVIGLCDAKTRVVPGHGEITDLSGLRGQIDYWNATRDAVAAAIKEGKSRAEAGKIQLPQFKDYGGESIRQMTLGVVYDQLKAAK
jgi:cyclase